jgi:hypothetical protein
VGIRRALRCLVGAFFLFAGLTGCQAFYSYRPLVVQVRDAETKKPLSGAVVHVHYPAGLDSTAPWESSGQSGADGIVRLRAALYGDEGIQLHADAPGYLKEELGVTAETLRQIEPTFFASDSDRPVNLALELYAEPFPYIELVVPKSYHGIIKVEVQESADTPSPSGQRAFRYPVPPSGLVSAQRTGLLRHFHSTDIRARWADGAELKAPPHPWEVGFLWLKTEGKVQYFFVGTQWEHDDYRRRLARRN